MKGLLSVILPSYQMEHLFWTMIRKLHAENGRQTEEEEPGFPDTVEPLTRPRLPTELSDERNNILSTGPPLLCLGF